MQNRVGGHGTSAAARRERGCLMQIVVMADGGDGGKGVGGVIERRLATVRGRTARCRLCGVRAGRIAAAAGGCLAESTGCV